MSQQTIYLFVFDTMADWEPALALAGLNAPMFPPSAGRYCVRTVGVRREPVVTMGGVTILPDCALEELGRAECAMLILPGGDSWDAGKNTEVIPYAERLLAAGVPVAAICGATAGLARAGLLDHARHTSNAPEYLQATGYQGAAHYQHDLAVTDGALITASGVAPVDFAAQIFRRLGLYPEDILEAWYDLFKTGDPSAYGRLIERASASMESAGH